MWPKKRSNNAKSKQRLFMIFIKIKKIRSIMLILYLLLLIHSIYSIKYVCDPSGKRFCMYGYQDENGNSYLTIHSSARGWAGFGIGQNMPNSDLYVVWKNSNGGYTLSRRFTTGHQMPNHRDPNGATVMAATGTPPSWASISATIFKPANQQYPLSSFTPLVWATSNLPVSNPDSADSDIMDHEHQGYIKNLELVSFRSSKASTQPSTANNVPSNSWNQQTGRVQNQATPNTWNQQNWYQQQQQQSLQQPRSRAASGAWQPAQDPLSSWPPSTAGSNADPLSSWPPASSRQQQILSTPQQIQQIPRFPNKLATLASTGAQVQSNSWQYPSSSTSPALGATRWSTSSRLFWPFSSSSSDTTGGTGVLQSWSVPGSASTAQQPVTQSQQPSMQSSSWNQQTPQQTPQQPRVSSPPIAWHGSNTLNSNLQNIASAQSSGWPQSSQWSSSGQSSTGQSPVINPGSAWPSNPAPSSMGSSASASIWQNGGTSSLSNPSGSSSSWQNGRNSASWNPTAASTSWQANQWSSPQQQQQQQQQTIPSASSFGSTRQSQTTSNWNGATTANQNAGSNSNLQSQLWSSGSSGVRNALSSGSNTNEKSGSSFSGQVIPFANSSPASSIIVESPTSTTTSSAASTPTDDSSSDSSDNQDKNAKDEIVSSKASSTPSEKHCEDGNTFCIYGQTNSDGNMVFTIHSASTGWNGIGIGDSMSSSDMYIVWKDSKNNYVLSRRASTGKRMPQYNSNVDGAKLIDSAVTAPSWASTSYSIVMPMNQLNSKTSFIYAYSEKNVDNPDSPSSSFGQHSSFGSVPGDVNFFASASQESPPTQENAAETESTQTPNGLVDQSNSETDPLEEAKSVAYRKTVVTHGVLMFIAWAISPFIGIFIARFLKKQLGKWWMRLHTFFLLVLTGIFALAGFIFILTFSPPPHFQNHSHGKLGIVVMIAMFIQIILGFISQTAYKSDGLVHVRLWNKIHRLLGPLVVLLGVINIGLGLNLFQSKFGLSQGVIIGFYVFIVIQIIFLMLGEYFLRRRKTVDYDNMDIDIEKY